jgi:hypothetical protein
MANHNIYTVGTESSVRITPNGIHSGMDITIQNVSSSGYIYIGGEGVASTSYGYRLMPNHAFSVELSGTDDLYLIASAPGTQAAVLSVSLEHGN